MSLRPRKQPEPQNYRWLIARNRGTPAPLLGFVKAPDRHSAIRQAIAQFKVKPEHQDRCWRYGPNDDNDVSAGHGENRYDTGSNVGHPNCVHFGHPVCLRVWRCISDPLKSPSQPTLQSKAAVGMVEMAARNFSGWTI
jgi:hypothetical protein